MFLEEIVKIKNKRKKEWELQSIKKNTRRGKNSKGKTNKMVAINEVADMYPNTLELTVNADGLKYYSKDNDYQAK